VERPGQRPGRAEVIGLGRGPGEVERSPRSLGSLARQGGASMNGITLWPHQEYALAEIPRLIEAGQRRILETTPTGGGKSLVMCGLIKWAVSRGWKAALYTNRQLLIAQLARVLTAHGIGFGVRSAGQEHDLTRHVQISSLPTEQARVFKAERWALHGA